MTSMSSPECESQILGTPEWPITPTNFFPIDVPTSPRLEVGEIDSVPFSQNFDDLFGGLGLHVSSAEQARKDIDPDMSYDIENFSNLKEIDPEWSHDEIDEIILISPKYQDRSQGLAPITGESSVLPEPTLRKVVLSDFEIDDLSSPSEVKTCTKRDTRMKYVIRRQHVRKDWSKMEQMVLEALRDISPPFISCMRWIFKAGEHIYHVLDYHGGATLSDLIDRHGPLPCHRVTFYAAELASGISSLHDAGIVHNALEPSNIAIETNGHIKITNFSQAFFLTGPRSKPVDADPKRHPVMNQYRAPEVYLRWKIDSAVDCWSFGMIMYYLLFTNQPYGPRGIEWEDGWLADKIVNCAVGVEGLRLVHPMVRDIMAKCMERNPVVRWNIEQIKGHDYFAGINWEQVASKGLDVPLNAPAVLNLGQKTFSDHHRRHVSLNSSPIEVDHRPKVDPSPSMLRRSHSVRGSRPERPLPKISVLPELFPSGNDLVIADVIQEEEEPVSAAASLRSPDFQELLMEECEEEIQEVEREKETDPVEKMTRIWAEIDKEQQGSRTTFASLEFGKAKGMFKAPKLRKYRSAMSAHRLFTSMSTSSFHIPGSKLLTRRKARMTTTTSAATLKLAKHAEPIEDLPMGLHQIGSGIGFTYNVPVAAPSKATLCSFTPACHPLFPKALGFPAALNRGLGLGHASRKTGTGDGVDERQTQSQAQTESTVQAGPGTSSEPFASSVTGVEHLPPMVRELGLRPRTLREVGNATFIRDMYACPSWILCPPESIPSPMALVNSSSATSCASPGLSSGYAGIGAGYSHGNSYGRGSSEPVTPATLFDSCVDAGPMRKDSRDQAYGIFPKSTNTDAEFEDAEADAPGEVTISINPKSLDIDIDLDLDFEKWASMPDATLRLVVPPSSTPRAGRAAAAVGVRKRDWRAGQPLEPPGSTTTMLRDDVDEDGQQRRSYSHGSFISGSYGDTSGDLEQTVNATGAVHGSRCGGA